MGEWCDYPRAKEGHDAEESVERKPDKYEGKEPVKLSSP